MALALVAISLTLKSVAGRVKNIEANMGAVLGIGGRMKSVQEDTQSVKTMHEHPDDYGFGSKETNKMLKGLMEACSTNCQEASRVWRSLDTLAYYIKYDVETRTGKKIPPPPLEVRG
jgi:hypothetical protein